VAESGNTIANASPQPKRVHETGSAGCCGPLAGVTKLKVLGFNDFHGHLVGTRSIDGRPVGGAAVLVAYLKEAQARARSRALIVHAGDHVGASPPASALLQDEPSIAFLNALGNEHCRPELPSRVDCNLVGTLGNHEFDEGASELLRLIGGGNHARGPFLESPYSGVHFDYVNANVVDAESGRPLLPPSIIRRVGEARIGLVGAVLRDTPSVVTPTGVRDLEFLDEAAAINAATEHLRGQGVEAIGVLIHQGGAQARYAGPTRHGEIVTGPIVEIVSQLDAGVDFVVTGHAHDFTNAFLPNREGKDVLVTQALSAGSAFAEIDLDVDLASGDVVSKSARIVLTYSDQAPGNAPDRAVESLVAAAEQRTAPLVQRVVARTSGVISRVESPAGESALGNLVADAQRAATGADIAFVNPGGLRADLGVGPVTWGALFSVLPFGNKLITVDLSGQQLIDLLNQQWRDGSSRVLKGSGLRYEWDPQVAPGADRIVHVEVGGKPLERGRSYRVTVNSFTAAGGDRFTVLCDGTNRSEGIGDLDAFVAYVERLQQPFDANIEGRIRIRP
jgi:5'-nucleotidase